MDVRSHIQMIRTAVIGRYTLWSPRAFIQPTISAFISAYLAVSAAVMLALPVLAYRWRQLPFMGAYVEQTLVFNSIRPQGDTPWAGIDAGLAFPAQLIAIDDQAVRTTRALQATLRTHTAGDEVTLSFTDDAANVHELQLILMEFPASDFNAFFVLPYAVGFVYLVLGVAVFISRSNRTSGRAYALFCGSTAIITGGLFDLYTTHIFSWAWSLAVPVAGASMITIGLAFPERLTFARRHPLASWIGFVPAVGLIIW
ncbi:MAG: hypothetical protein ACE5FI_16170, partial [Anaerolineales bacterium]